MKETYSDAFFDEIVFVSFELMLQPIRLRPHRLRFAIHPFSIQSRFGVTRGDFCERLGGSFVSAGIFSCFGFGDC